MQHDKAMAILGHTGRGVPLYTYSDENLFIWLMDLQP